ncbi:hypothetical protein MMPV_004112 [Pyropia vietnamensis]
MPVDLKLKTLRRLFGVASFFPQYAALRSNGRRAAPAAASAAAAADGASPANDSEQPRGHGGRGRRPSRGRRHGGQDGDGDGDDSPWAAAAAQRTPLLDRSSSATSTLPRGGIPTAFFSGVPPRAVRGKTVSLTLSHAALLEKQKLKVYYGCLRDGTLSRAVESARCERIDVDAALLRRLEERLATVVYRTGWTGSLMTARQWVSHGHITVNGAVADIPGMVIGAGDVIAVTDGYWRSAAVEAERAAEMRLRLGAGATHTPAVVGGGRTGAGTIPWLAVDRVAMAAAVLRRPQTEELRALTRAALFPVIRDAALDPALAMRAYR